MKLFSVEEFFIKVDSLNELIGCGHVRRDVITIFKENSIWGRNG